MTSTLTSVNVIQLGQRVRLGQTGQVGPGQRVSTCGSGQTGSVWVVRGLIRFGLSSPDLGQDHPPRLKLGAGNRPGHKPEACLARLDNGGRRTGSGGAWQPRAVVGVVWGGHKRILETFHISRQDKDINYECWRLRVCENRLSGVARACVGEWKCFYMIEQWIHARDDDMMIDFTSHALWALRVVAPLSDRRVRGIEILPGSLAWGKARKQGGSILTFVQVRFLGIMGGTDTSREGIETFSMKVSKPCPKVSIPLMQILILPERVVYRSWTFGFDSDIPRVTISGRFCDWTGSRGLHLLVSEPDYAIIGTVSEIQAPIAYTTIENVVLVKRLGQIGSLPLLTRISLFNGNEEILPPPSVGGEEYLHSEEDLLAF
ncbi:hypothetical protein GQ457_05G035880 [Hibiscus cannabinus]